MHTQYGIRKSEGNTVPHRHAVDLRQPWLSSGSGSLFIKHQEKPAKKQKTSRKNTSKLNASLNLNPNDILSCLRSAYAQLSSVEQQAVERYGLNDASQLLVNQRALHLHCKVVKKKLEQAATLIKHLSEGSNAPHFRLLQKDGGIENAGRMEVKGFHDMCGAMRESGRLHMKELVEKTKEESE